MRLLCRVCSSAPQRASYSHSLRTSLQRPVPARSGDSLRPEDFAAPSPATPSPPSRSLPSPSGIQTPSRVPVTPRHSPRGAPPPARGGSRTSAREIERYLPFRRRADRTCPPPELGASTFAVRGVPPPTPPLWTEVGRPSSRVHVLVTRSPCHPHPSCIRRSRRFASLVRSALVVQRGAVSGPRRGWRRPPSSSLLWISQ